SFLTGVVAMQNASTHTTCTGRSHAWPDGKPMRNGPATTSTKSTPRSVASVDPVSPSVPEIRYRCVFGLLKGFRATGPERCLISGMMILGTDRLLRLGHALLGFGNFCALV